MTEPILLAPGEGETVADEPARTVRILLEHELADVTWSRYEAGERGPGPHVHRHHVDAFFVLEGELEFGVGPDVTPVRAPAGTLVLVPQLVVHTFGNESRATATFLNVHAPSCGFAEHLRDDDAPFDSEDPPADGGRDPADAVVTPAGGGERFVRPTHAIVVTVDLPELSAHEITFGPGLEVSPHTHADHVDSFFVLDAGVEFAPGGSWTTPVPPGTFTAAPPGVVHGFRGVAEGARALNLHTPDGGFANSVRRHVG